jgi:hypothetical protein
LTITDTDRGIMWLQDANYAKTSGYDTDGSMTWWVAMDWADTLIFAGYYDWRLPSALNSDGSRPCTGLLCTDSEFGHLYHIELENPVGGPMTNVGPFINIQSSGYYWTETVVVPSVAAHSFNFSDGTLGEDIVDFRGWALAVRDISVIPEPISLTLFLVGGSTLGFRIFRNNRWGTRES